MTEIRVAREPHRQEGAGDLESTLLQVSTEDRDPNRFQEVPADEVLAHPADPEHDPERDHDREQDADHARDHEGRRDSARPDHVVPREARDRDRQPGQAHHRAGLGLEDRELPREEAQELGSAAFEDLDQALCFVELVRFGHVFSKPA